MTINNKIIYYNNQKPFFIHAPSCTKLNNILIKLNYNIKQKEITNINNEFQKYLINKTKFYVNTIIKNNKLFIIILVLITIIFFMLQ